MISTEENVSQPRKLCGGVIRSLRNIAILTSEGFGIQIFMNISGLLSGSGSDVQLNRDNIRIQNLRVSTGLNTENFVINLLHKNYLKFSLKS